MIDFRVSDFGTVWNIQAVSADAIAFAEDNFPVEGWQGVAANFNTDHRAGRDLAHRLIDEGWQVLIN